MGLVAVWGVRVSRVHLKAGLFVSFAALSTGDFSEAQAVASVTCPPMTTAGLEKRLSSGASESIRLVFFSSWCSDCAVHLKRLKPSDEAIIIGIFDKRERIERAVSRLNLTQPCFTDAGVGKFLNVTVVPTERTVDLKVFNLKK